MGKRERRRGGREKRGEGEKEMGGRKGGRDDTPLSLAPEPLCAEVDGED